MNSTETKETLTSSSSDTYGCYYDQPEMVQLTMGGGDNETKASEVEYTETTETYCTFRDPSEKVPLTSRINSPTSPPSSPLLITRERKDDIEHIVCIGLCNRPGRGGEPNKRRPKNSELAHGYIVSMSHGDIVYRTLIGITVGLSLVFVLLTGILLLRQSMRQELAANRITGADEVTTINRTVIQVTTTIRGKMHAFPKCLRYL